MALKTIEHKGIRVQELSALYAFESARVDPGNPMLLDALALAHALIDEDGNRMLQSVDEAMAWLASEPAETASVVLEALSLLSPMGVDEAEKK